MEASAAGSPTYVFTDAPASDEDRLLEARSLIVRKNLRVSFVYVDALRGKRSLPGDHQMKNKRQAKDENIYEYLASFSGGQFLNVQTSEISDLASLVSFSAIQSCHTIFHVSRTMYGMVEHFIPVDSSVFEVLISINGDRIAVSIYTPQGKPVKVLLSFIIIFWTVH